MRYMLFVIIFFSIARILYAGNNYIEFGQFEKVQRVSVAAGALYACSKNESLEWPKRHGYLYLHFKLDQVVTDYFKLSYRVIAIQDFPLSERVTMVDEHRKVEKQVNTLQETGYNAVQKGEMKCEEVAAFADEVWKYQE